MLRIVCQRLAPTFQHASRKARGTEANASLVLAMIASNGNTMQSVMAPKTPWATISVRRFFRTSEVSLKVFCGGAARRAAVGAAIPAFARADGRSADFAERVSKGAVLS